MTALPAGIVLPDAVLTSTWFIGFSLFVALNTVIYLGLTLAKFMPWPTQVRPATVRHLLPLAAEREYAMPPSLRGDADSPPSPPDAEQSIRKAEARDTIPLGLGLVGALTVLVGLINTILYLNAIGPLILLGPILGLLLIALSQFLARARVGDSGLIWSWTLAMLVLVIETAWRAAVLDSAVLLAYSAMALIVIPPIAMSWRAGIVAAIVGVVPIAIAGYFVSFVDTVSWAIAAVTASLAGLVILRLRLTAVSRLAEEQQRSHALASTDPTTGAFTRTGLLALAPTVAEAATRADAQVAVVLCVVDDLPTLNEAYGFAYGDDVLRVTVRAMWNALPEGTLVSRWGGSDVLGLAIGALPAVEAIRTAIDDGIAASGIALGKRPPSFSVATAHGDPSRVTLEELVARAERDLPGAAREIATATD